MNIFSFITVSGTYTLQAGWSSVLIVPDGTVQVVNGASPPESLTITAPLKMGNGVNLYSQLVINGNAKLVINGDSVVSNHVVPGSAVWGAISGSPSNQTDLQNGTIQGTFTPANSAVVTGDTFKAAFQKLQGQISGISLSSRWAITGNTLAVRGTFGGTAGTTLGWDYIINGVTIGGWSNGGVLSTLNGITTTSIEMSGAITAAGINSVDPVNRLLKNSLGNTTVNYESALLTSSGLTLVRWGDAELLDASGVVSVYWNNRTLRDSSSNVRYDWQNGIQYLDEIYDLSGLKAIDVTMRQIMYDTFIVFDGNSGWLKWNNIVALDFQYRVLADTTGANLADWQSPTQGIRYANELSATFVDRSLVDKGYVLSVIGFSGNFSGVGTATTTFTVTIGSTMANNTYKVVASPSNVLSSALFYIDNKTTTTFDVVYLAGLTGTVAFDWILKP